MDCLVVIVYGTYTSRLVQMFVAAACYLAISLADFKLIEIIDWHVMIDKNPPPNLEILTKFPEIKTQLSGRRRTQGNVTEKTDGSSGYDTPRSLGVYSEEC